VGATAEAEERPETIEEYLGAFRDLKISKLYVELYCYTLLSARSGKVHISALVVLCLSNGMVTSISYHNLRTFI
jgi:hypothetical protein